MNRFLLAIVFALSNALFVSPSPIKNGKSDIGQEKTGESEQLRNLGGDRCISVELREDYLSQEASFEMLSLLLQQLPSGEPLDFSLLDKYQTELTVECNKVGGSVYKLSADLDDTCMEKYADSETLSVFDSTGTNFRDLPLCLKDCDSASVRDLFETGVGSECFTKLEATSSANTFVPGRFVAILSIATAFVSMVIM